MKTVPRDQFYAAVMPIDTVIGIPFNQSDTVEYRMRNSGKLVGKSVDTDDYNEDGSVVRNYFLTEKN